MGAVGRPIKPIDPATTGEYVGKTVLVGVTALGRRNRATGQGQWVGRIARLSSEEGIVIELDGDERLCVLPPDLGNLVPAKPGVYRLHSTGRVVENPAFLTTWTYRNRGLAGRMFYCWRRARRWMTRRRAV